MKNNPYIEKYNKEVKRNYFKNVHKQYIENISNCIQKEGYKKTLKRIHEESADEQQEHIALECFVMLLKQN